MSIKICLSQKLRRLAVLGDGQMRVLFQYLMNATGWINATVFEYQKDNIQAYGNRFMFASLPSIDKLVPYLREQNNLQWPFFWNTNQTFDGRKTNDNGLWEIKRNDSRRNIIVIGIGSLDMKEYGLSYFIDVVVPSLKMLLTQTNAQMRDRLKLFVVTQLPVGDKFNSSITGKRNNAAIGAAQAAMMNELRFTDINIIDGYSMLLARSYETYEEHQVTPLIVTSPLGSEKIVRFEGEGGIAVIQAIIDKLCQ